MNKKVFSHKTIIKYTLVILISTIIQLGLLVAVALIPRSAIQSNMNESASYLLEKDVFFYLNEEDRSSYIDRYADSILLNIAYNYDSKHPIISVMSSSYYFTSTHNENENLNTTVTSNVEPTLDYIRYWHGSNVILRPLLTLLNIKEIYILNGIVLFILIISTLLLIKKYLGTAVSVCLSISMIATSIWYVPFSLEYTWTILLMLVACILTLVLRDKNTTVLYSLFIVIGSFTAYLDFLTTETLTLMIPLIILLIYNRENMDSLKSSIKFTFPMFFAWGVGYVSAWLIKWSLASVILKENVFSMALKQAQYRISGETDTISGVAKNISAIIRNITCLFPYSWTEKNVFFLFNITLGIIFVIYYLFKSQKKSYLSSFLLMLGCVPYLRYFILANHSYIHYFFTYRAQMTTIFCIGLLITFGIDKQLIKKQINKLKKGLQYGKNQFRINYIDALPK